MTDSTKFLQNQNIYSELENQIFQLKACVIIEQQIPPIVIKDKNIKFSTKIAGRNRKSSNNSNQAINEARTKTDHNITKSIQFVYRYRGKVQ